MSPRYTSEKLDKSIKSIKDVIENNKKITKSYQDLLYSFERIKIAMIPDFDKMLKQIVNNKIDEIYKEKIKEDPNYSKSSCAMLARRKIMMESKFFRNTESFPRWDDFKWQFKKIWENDRAKLIQESEIKGEPIKDKNFKIVKFSQLKAHDNLSAEFWVNHDESKCKKCKEALKN